MRNKTIAQLEGGDPDRRLAKPVFLYVNSLARPAGSTRSRQDNLGLLDPTTRRQRECRLKSEFAFFQSLKRLFLPTYVVKCCRSLLKLNFKGKYPSSERE